MCGIVVVSESVFRGLGKGESGLCLCWGLLGARLGIKRSTRS